MEMPVIVGVVLVLMFLVSFSGWFFNIASGTRLLVLDDEFFGWRIVGTTVVSIVFMVGVFFGIATINECRYEKREGLFASLKCEEYQVLSSSAKGFFQLDK